jgi:hypothetical protein
LAQKRKSLVFIVATATLALSVAVVWRTVHGRSSPQSPYVGPWRFTSGEIKAGPGFFVSDKVAPDGTTSQSLAGHLAVIELRDGVLWYAGDEGKSCSYELRVGDGKAEVVPDGKVECDTSAPDGGPKRADYLRMSMVVDAQDRAHVSGEVRTSFERKGQRRDVTVTYEGVAVRDMPPAPDGGV